LAITGSANELTRFDYDNLDRMIGRYEPDLTSNWIFDTAARGIGQLAEAYTSTGTVKDYRRVHTYDTFARPQKTTQTLSDGSYSSESTYDAWGRLITQTYQRNAEAVKKFENRYQNGYLARVERGSLVLWKINTQDASQRPTSATLGNGLTQVHRFNDYNGQIETGTLSTTAGGARLQESYEYDAMGNVGKRMQYWDQGGFQENFTYDALNRIETSVLLGQAVQTFTYDDAGNLLTKTGVGTGAYQYPAQGASAVRPHAVQTIPGIGSFNYDDNGNLTGGAGRTVEWTSFDMPVKITANQTTATFVYGAEHQRTRQVRGDGSTVIYAGAQEVEKNASGTVVKTYWPAGIGLEIDRPGSTASELLWYHHDRLGSVIGLTDQQGTLAEKLAYDAWGKRRTIDGALVNGTSTPNNLDGKNDYRGFTGHEMLDQLDLVHMNGRIYDPLVARFLSGDPFIQDPVDGQNYNRYTYVLNNPTNNTDPTGFNCETITGSRLCGVETGAKCSGNCEISDGPKDNKGRSDTKRDQQRDPKGNANNASKSPGSANKEPTYSRVGFSSVSGQANDGSSVQVITDTWRRDSRYYGTPGQIMAQWFSFNPVEYIARDMGASQQQAYWLGVASMAVGVPKQAVSSVATKFMNPSSIRFSQSSIKANFSNGGSLEKMVDALRSGALAAGEVPAIRLVEKEGLLFTLDNRRLEAFRRAGVEVPYRMATPDEIVNETWKFTTRNKGISIRVRGE
jgi:RHS repeat-associated protein